MYRKDIVDPAAAPATAAAKRTQRALFRSGAVLLTAALLQPALAFVVNPQWALGLIATMGAELVTGREAAIPLALAQGVPAPWIAATSVLQNLGLAALVVPAVLAMLERATRAGRLERHVDRITAKARHYEGRVNGAWAVFAFMLIPFLSNGPIIAGLLGRWAKVPWRYLVPAVVAGVLVTATAWSFAYAWLARILAGVHPALEALPSWLAGLAIAIVVGRALWTAIRERARANQATCPSHSAPAAESAASEAK